MPPSHPLKSQPGRADVHRDVMRRHLRYLAPRFRLIISGYDITHGAWTSLTELYHGAGFHAGGTPPVSAAGLHHG